MMTRKEEKVDLALQEINNMNKIIIEVGSTNVKIDKYDGRCVKRLEEITIFFKKHYCEDKKIRQSDIDKLVNRVNDLKKEYDDIYVCGTSIFRTLNDKEKSEFLNEFKKETGIDFHIISQEQECELTVLGATRFVNKPVSVFIGGGGSTEIASFDKEIKKIVNSPIGVMDVMDVFPDLDDDIAKSSLEDVKKYIKDRINIPDEKADLLILAGGGHEMFARDSGIQYEANTLYNDDVAPIMMDIDTRVKETIRYFQEISLDEIKNRVTNPNWWSATRAMCAFVLVVAEAIEAKYIIPTNVGMVYGIIDSNNQ